MALQISYTDRRGVTNTQAYVRIEAIEYDIVNSICKFRVNFYHNATTRSKADESQRKRIIEGIQYQLWGSPYNTYLAESVLKAEDKSLISQLYVWLKTHVDLQDHIQPDDRFNHGHNINWTTATDV